MTAGARTAAAWRSVAGPVCLTALALLSSCGDGRPPFCDDLVGMRSLEPLGAAIEAGDLDAASGEAAELEELVGAAPREIRPEFEALAAGVTDIVALLEAEEGPTTDGAEVERRRKELNERLGELSDDSSAVAAWTEENCGFSLS